jgi:hypothetical protein
LQGTAHIASAVTAAVAAGVRAFREFRQEEQCAAAAGKSPAEFLVSPTNGETLRRDKEKDHD